MKMKSKINPYLGKVPTKSFNEAVKCIMTYEKAGIDLEQIFATVTTEKRKKAWAKKWGLTKSRKTPTLKNFLGSKKEEKPSWVDHESLWNKNGKPYTFVMQPYDINNYDFKDLKKFCEQHKLEIIISAQDSWDYPSRTTLIMLTKKED